MLECTVESIWLAIHIGITYWVRAAPPYYCAPPPSISDLGLNLIINIEMFMNNLESSIDIERFLQGYMNTQFQEELCREGEKGMLLLLPLKWHKIQLFFILSMGFSTNHVLGR
jgi:hypothetical protein